LREGSAAVRVLAPLLLAGGLVSVPGGAEAQPVEALARSCAGDLWEVVPRATERCTDIAVAAWAIHAGIGLLAGGGGPFPSSPSTAGWRVERSPRWVMDAGVAFASFRYPDPEDAGFRERGTVAGAPRFTVGAGLFEGFSPAPTVGGVGAVDAVGELRILPIGGPGGRAGSVAVWGAGVRLGVLRESFTLPGVTISAMHRRAGEVRVGRPEAGGGEVRVQPNVTSLRAVAGKDLLEIGVAGGVQWDRIRGTGRTATTWTDAGATEAELLRSGRRSIPLDRSTWFVGLNRTWVVAQVTAEASWSPAASPGPDLEGGGGFDGGSGSFVGSLSVRITY
jgi:hypothetical protein